MMAESRGYLVATALLFLCLAFADAEEAIDRAGRKGKGILLQEKDAWLFQTDLGKRILLGEISYLRFDHKTLPSPAVPLTQTLLLANHQRVSGMLRSLNDQKITLVTSWGKVVSVPCAVSVGLVQNALPIVYDDFETSLKPWRVAGQASRDSARAFFGKSSLRLHRGVQSATRDWPAFRHGTVQLCFYDPALEAGSRWRFQIILDVLRKDNPGFVIDKGDYGCPNMKQRRGFVKAKPGWHLLAIELANGRLRIFVDDLCLGEDTISTDGAIKGIRVAPVEAAHDSNQLWLDELMVTRSLAPLATPMPVREQNIVWLEHGEQIFGRVVSADALAVLFDAKFGKRSFPWSQVRGILFANQKSTTASLDPEITFRPGPGFPVDCLRAKLLRWEGTKLMLQHELLGEIGLERDRLDTIRFTAK